RSEKCQNRKSPLASQEVETRHTADMYTYIFLGGLILGSIIGFGLPVQIVTAGNSMSSVQDDTGETKFRHLLDAAPGMVWVSAPDKLCTFFNKPWLSFTGRT